MGLDRINIGTNEDGSTRWQFIQNPLDPSKPVMFTGPITGDVQTSDGTTYNVTDDWIELDSHAHAGEVDHLIGVRHENEGHPAHTDGTPFTHLCTETCGALRRDPSDPAQAAAIERAKAHRAGLDDPAAQEQLDRLIGEAEKKVRRTRTENA